MAKAPKQTATPTAAAASPETAAPLFKIEVSGPPPARTIGGAVAGRGESRYTPFLNAMSAPSGDRYHSFFVPVSLEGEQANLTGEERTKALKDAARSVQNGISSVTRRLKKQDASKEYAMRAGNETEGDASTPYGVRVWRIAPKEVAPKQAPATPAVPAAPVAPAAPAVPAVPSVPQVPSL